MPARHIYRLDLAGRPMRPDGGRSIYRLAQPAPADAEALAVLMLDAYRGTIDFDDETLDDARAEVAGFLDGRDGPPMLECSWAAWSDGELAAACLAGWWAAREAPLIAYCLTRAIDKGRGLGTWLLARTLDALAEAGHGAVWAVITDGNLPSQALFRRAGFAHVDQGPDGEVVRAAASP